MESIELLRSDKLPLVSLDKAVGVTGMQLGNLLIHLADKDVSLFLKRPKEAHIYCVTQSLAMTFRKGTYPEAIFSPPRETNPSGFIKPKRGDDHIDANHFDYLVLSSYDYRSLTERDSALSAKLFGQTAYVNKSKPAPITVDASGYFREHLPKTSPLKELKAKFACYVRNEEHPSALKLINVNINPEELLVSRTALLDLFNTQEKTHDAFPSELTEHLQPWKSDFLRALNIAAYELYSKMSKIEARNSEKKAQDIQESIKKQLPRNSQASTKISTAAPLLRHEVDQSDAKNYLDNKDIDTRKYPHYFSHSLMYLNEKSKEYHDAYITLKDRHPVYIRDIINEFKTDKVIPGNTEKRIANVVKPNYEEIKRHGE
ncbi:MAG: hypothetical protein U9Q35_03365 [Pseudomonadota bacterium]|nr:hypothetical protein [Pseudomonadota bacterium]